METTTPVQQAPSFALSLTAYLKTAEGQALVNSQKMFCYEARLWQGYNGSCIVVYDHQPTKAELAGALDMDGTKARILQRMDSARFALKRLVDEESARTRGKEALNRMEALKAKQLERELGLEGASMAELLDGPSARPTEPPPTPAGDILADDPAAEFRVPAGLHPELTTVPQIEEANQIAQEGSKLDAILESNLAINRTLGALVETLADRRGVGTLAQEVAAHTEENPVPIEEDHPAVEMVPDVVVQRGRESVECPECGKHSPVGHKNPPGWLRGHSMGLHKKRLA